MISSYEIELKELQDNKKQDNEEAMKNLENLFKNI